jgi:hypothetical protein
MSKVFTDSLSNYIDFSKLDMRKIFEESKKSMLIMVCEYWNNKSELETTTSLVKKFKISNVTISKYLKRGTELGLCYYNPVVEKSKTSRSNVLNGNQLKSVIQYSLDGVEIARFNSIANAERCTGANRIVIGRVCKGLDKTAGGYRWKYADLN